MLKKQLLLPLNDDYKSLLCQINIINAISKDGTDSQINLGGKIAEFSHRICLEFTKKRYPEFCDQILIF